MLVVPEPTVSAATPETIALQTLQSRFSSRPVDVSFRELVGALPADELTHGLYPYPARLLRQIPRMLLNCEQVIGGIDRVVDPFCGSGTVLLEAQERGIDAHGIEQNPIGVLVSRVKTTPMDGSVLALAAGEVHESAKRGRRFANAPDYLRRWYSVEAFSALARISRSIDEYDGPVGDALALGLALTARKVATTDRRIPVPVSPKVKPVYKARDVWTTWITETTRISRRVSRLSGTSSTTTVSYGDSRDSGSWPADASASKTLVFTSPPYGAAQKYIRSTSLELGWLGHSSPRGTIDLERNSIGREHLSPGELLKSNEHGLTRRIDKVLKEAHSHSAIRGAIYSNYFADMARVFAQVDLHAARIVLVSGTNTVGGSEIMTYDLLADMLHSLGFRRTLSLRDEIRGRALLTKRRASGSPSPAEYIDIFEQGR